jgi:hypothetical protein
LLWAQVNWLACHNANLANGFHISSKHISSSSNEKGLSKSPISKTLSLAKEAIEHTQNPKKRFKMILKKTQKKVVKKTLKVSPKRSPKKTT